MSFEEVRATTASRVTWGDSMYGGTGADIFAYEYFYKEAFEGYREDVFDTRLGAGSRDVIKDFEVGVDKISFKLFFNALDSTLSP